MESEFRSSNVEFCTRFDCAVLLFWQRNIYLGMKNTSVQSVFWAEIMSHSSLISEPSLVPCTWQVLRICLLNKQEMRILGTCLSPFGLILQFLVDKNKVEKNIYILHMVSESRLLKISPSNCTKRDDCPFLSQTSAHMWHISSLKKDQTS